MSKTWKIVLIIVAILTIVGIVIYWLFRKSVAASEGFSPSAEAEIEALKVSLGPEAYANFKRQVARFNNKIVTDQKDIKTVIQSQVKGTFMTQIDKLYVLKINLSGDPILRQLSLNPQDTLNLFGPSTWISTRDKVLDRLQIMDAEVYSLIPKGDSLDLKTFIS